MKTEKSKLSEPRRLANRRYNQEHYRQPPVSIERDMLSVFKNACAFLKITQTSVIKNAMLDTIEKAFDLREYEFFVGKSMDELKEFVNRMP